VRKMNLTIDEYTGGLAVDPTVVIDKDYISASVKKQVDVSLFTRRGTQSSSKRSFFYPVWASESVEVEAIDETSAK